MKTKSMVMMALAGASAIGIAAAVNESMKNKDMRSKMMKAASKIMP